MNIDSHQHFWRYNSRDYDWIGDDMRSLRRDFLPPELKVNMDKTGMDGTISIQARQTLEETDWLLELASEYPFILGVVGWLPVASKRIQQILENYAGKQKLKALRHVIQDEKDDDFILDQNFNRGISQLKKFNLVYDILIYERQLPRTIQFVDNHPNQVFVLDHIAKPRIASGQLYPWKSHIIDLAKRGNVYCKISGLVTEADVTGWSENQLKPYLDTVLNAFKPERLIFGSDWPVCTAGIQYKDWSDMVRKFICSLSADEQSAIMGKNAQAVYSLNSLN